MIKIKKDISAVLTERAKNLATKGDLGSLDRGDEFVTFRLGKETYGISSDLVGEVFPAKDVTPLPGVPNFILGIVNVRGKIVSVNDLRAILDLPDSPESEHFILVLRSKSMEIGLWVEPPVDVMTTPPRSLDPPIPSSSGAIEYISGICKDVVILNGDRLLSAPSLVVKEVL
ncbi:MAG: chemotaxis protein CheW [Dethiosulfovibrio sp.]|nr:chemotaxis protein CheW [Dethiosulfovibrio sp.]